jgi:hypothetical protein
MKSHETWSHTNAVIVNDTIFIFGGENNNYKTVNRFYSLDLNSVSWK